MLLTIPTCLGLQSGEICRFSENSYKSFGCRYILKLVLVVIAAQNANTDPVHKAPSEPLPPYIEYILRYICIILIIYSFG